MSGRSLEAIKGQRRPQTYKKMVWDIFNNLTELSTSTSSSSSSSEADVTIVSNNYSLAQTGNNVDPHNLESPSIRNFQTADDDGQEFNMYEDTIIYNSPEIFINSLNSDRQLGGQPTVEEMELLHQALLSIGDVEKSKTLVKAYIDTLVKPLESCLGRNVRPNSTNKKLSNRKLKRIRYTKFQRFYKKNRKKAFDSLYGNNSTSDLLTSDIVFGYWKYLLTHKAINDPVQPTFCNDPVEFDTDLLIYPDEVSDCNPKGKSAAGPDGLSIYDILKINNRVKSKL